MVSFQKQREYFLKKLEHYQDKLQSEEVFDQNSFNRNLAKFKKLIALTEEVNLKEKFTIKRALVLCRSLLKACRQTNENDHNLMQICSTVIGPALNSHDSANMGIALECVGLLTLLNKHIFSNYA